MTDYMIRDGKRVAPFCSECGCRLGEFESMWYHYIDPQEENEPVIDAKGHRCSLLNVAIELPQ